MFLFNVLLFDWYGDVFDLGCVIVDFMMLLFVECDVYVDVSVVDMVCVF